MRKNYLKTLIYNLVLVSVFFLIQSCDSLDKVQKEWTDGPEQIYVGKIDSLYVRSGMNKVEIVGKTNYIRTAKTCVVRYEDKSVDFNIEDIMYPDGTAHLLIEDLTPGSYYFYVTTYDEAGNRSIESEVYGTAYDKDELDYIAPYTISSIMPRSEEGPATIYWNEMGSAYFYRTYLELSYVDAEGGTNKVLVEPDAEGVFPSKTVVDSWMPGGEITVQTYVQRKETDLEPFLLVPEKTSFPADIQWAIPRFGEGSTMDLGPSMDYNISDEYTIELMMRCSEIQDKDGCIIGSTGSGTAMLLRTSHNKIEHYINNTNWDWKAISYEGIEAGKWYHVAVTFVSGQRYTIYIDGELVAEGTDCGSLSPSESHLVVGTRTDHQVDFMLGDVQHVSIWEKARTAEQIKADMAFDFDENTEGLIAYWPMNLEPAGPVDDITGNHTAVFNKVQWYPAE